MTPHLAQLGMGPWQLASDVLIAFFIFSVLGWIAEVTYCAAGDGKFTNRGFLNGPVVPIYAFGALAVMYLLEPVSGNALWVFVGGALICSVLEGVTGWAMERLFHARWWDYSDQPFNIGGYICLKMSILWGVACLVLVRVLEPPIIRFITWLPDGVQAALVGIMLTVFLVDLAASVQTALKLKHRLDSLAKVGAELREFSDRWGAHLAADSIAAAQRAKQTKTDWDEAAEDARNRLEQRRKELRDVHDRRVQRLLTAFPRLRSLDHPAELDAIRHAHPSEDRPGKERPGENHSPDSNAAGR